MSTLKNIWQLIAHLPPVIVLGPYKLLHLGYEVYGWLLYYIALYTFKLQYTLTPECCRAEIDKALAEQDEISL